MQPTSKRRRRLLTASLAALPSAFAAPADTALKAPSVRGGVKSVSDFGARGDDDSDDSGPLQMALDSLRERDDYLLFPPGVYRVTRPLLLNAKRRVFLSGPGAVISMLKPGSGSILRIRDCEQVTVTGLFFNSDGTNNGHGLSLEHSPYTKLRDISIWDVGACCLHATRSWWLSTQDCVFNKPGPGYSAVHHEHDMNNVVHIHSRFSGYYRSGKRLHSVRRGLSHNRGAAVLLLACDFSGCSHGVDVHAGSSVTLSACYFEDNMRSIVLGDRTDGPRNVSIVNCYFQQEEPPDPIAIQIERALGVVVSNNYILGRLDNSSVGIQIGRDARNIEFQMQPADNCVGVTIPLHDLRA